MTQVTITQEQLLAMPASDYMSAPQLAFFKHLLLNRKAKLQKLLSDRAETLRGESDNRLPDIADTASVEEQRSMELRMLQRYQSELKEIGCALDRIEEEAYGWCEQSGAEITLPRLLVAPTASLCVDAQETLERRAQHQRVA
jgi:DnaK suppressor protein